MTADEILRKGLETLTERGKQYGDGQQGERNMVDIVAIFNAATGHKLSVRDGWLFMVALKLKRAASGGVDCFIDGANYFALAGEEAIDKGKQIPPAHHSPVRVWYECGCDCTFVHGSVSDFCERHGAAAIFGPWKA